MELQRRKLKKRIDRRVLDDNDINKVYGKEDEQSKVTNIEESTQTKEKNEKELNLYKTDVTGEITTKTEKITKEIVKAEEEKIKQDEKMNKELV